MLCATRLCCCRGGTKKSDPRMITGPDFGLRDELVISEFSHSCLLSGMTGAMFFENCIEGNGDRGEALSFPDNS